MSCYLNSKVLEQILQQTITTILRRKIVILNDKILLILQQSKKTRQESMLERQPRLEVRQVAQIDQRLPLQRLQLSLL